MGLMLKILKFLKLDQVYRQKVWMRAYGAPSLKPSCLWSNSKLIGELGHDLVTPATRLHNSTNERSCLLHDASAQEHSF